MCGDSSHREIIEKYCDSIIQVLIKFTMWKNMECHCKSSKVNWKSKVDFLEKTANCNIRYG